MLENNAVSVLAALWLILVLFSDRLDSCCSFLLFLQQWRQVALLQSSRYPQRKQNRTWNISRWNQRSMWCLLLDALCCVYPDALSEAISVRCIGALAVCGFVFVCGVGTSTHMLFCSCTQPVSFCFPFISLSLCLLLTFICWGTGTDLVCYQFCSSPHYQCTECLMSGLG